MKTGVHRERIKPPPINESGKGGYVLYWMQRAQRVRFNHALKFAVERANQLGVPLLVLFCLTGSYPGANLRHYAFMLQGMEETASALRDRGIGFLMALSEPVEGVLSAARSACEVVTDSAYTHTPRQWRSQVEARIEVPFWQVETDIVVPVETASIKEEYAAYTIRKKINRLRDDFLVESDCEDIGKPWRGSDTDFGLKRVDPSSVDHVLDCLETDRSVKSVRRFTGGSSRGTALLEDFLNNKLDRYKDDRNDPNKDSTSLLSPYFHFGQVSPVEVAIKVQDAGSPGGTAFLEELIVRRELAINFTYYNKDYDGFACLPRWCRQTIDEHRQDPREYQYSQSQWEKAETHDIYWNAAQKELLCTGRIHGYMRMYWGKKILEWTRDPEEAYRIAVYLNDRYQLDGRDPNGYAGVAWCFGKHDRPWARREVYGMIRYMNANGLKRKFDADAYVRAVDEMCRQEERA